MLKPKDVLKTLMQENGVSTTKLGQEMGGAKYQVAAVRILGSDKEPTRKALKPFADFFNVPIERFYNDNNESTDIVRLDNNILPATDKHGRPMKMRRLPVVSWVQAGSWHEAIDNYAVGDAEEWIYVIGSLSEQSFSLKIQGDSMTDEFKPGEYVAVDPAREARNGSFVIAKLEDTNEATFKQLVLDAGQAFLKPLNSQYPIIDVTGREDFKICGVVVQKVMQYE